MSHTVQQEYYDDPATGERKAYAENEDHVVDPTAMTGTLETTDTSGVNRTAADVSPVFDVADAENAEHPAVVGGGDPNPAFAPEADPAAEGENALDPVYGDGEGPGEQSGESFDASKDPGEYTVKDVTAFLANASDEDKAKVIEAEKAGNGRKGIVEA